MAAIQDSRAIFSEPDNLTRDSTLFTAACDRAFINMGHHGMIKNLFCKLFWLRGENQYLRQKIQNVRREEKRCWNCGMRGHLARACCYKSHTECNWQKDTVSSESSTPWLPDSPALTPISEVNTQTVEPINCDCEPQRLDLG